MVLTCSFWVVGQAQKYTLAGHITDTLDQGIELASVLLLQKEDSIMAGFSITNPKGRFKIDDLMPGDYIMNITFLGYAEVNKSVTVAQNLDLGNVYLRESSQTLSEILISASHIPIQVNNDTIQYNADAFKTRVSDNVEALLKKLPGIEVADDGTITAHGEEVENVFVEGKEFFGSDPTIATKNLPADAIENVQVFDKSSDMAEFSGIDDGERQKSINLVLKEGKKAGYFGNGSIGYGTKDRYEGKFNINRFTSETQMSAIGMANNVNKQGFSFREYIDFMGGIGNISGGGRGSTSDTGIPISNGLGDGFVNTTAGGLNYNIEPTKNLEINSSYFYNSINNDINQEVQRQSLVDNGGFDTEQIGELVNLNKNHKINSKIVAQIDTSKKLITRISAGWNNGTSESKSTSNNYNEEGNLVSGGIYDNASIGEQANASIQLTYMNRLKKKGRFFAVNGRYSYNDNHQSADLNSINNRVINGVDNIEALLQEQLQSNLQNNYSFKLSLTEPLGNRRYFELNASRSNNKNDFDKDFYDLTGNGSDLESVLNEQLSNNYKRNYAYNRLGFNFKLNKNTSSLTVGTNLQHSDLNGELKNEGAVINQDYFYLLPSLFYNKDISASRSLSVRYSTSIREPSLEQLQPIVDNSNPLNIYVGNPNLQPSYRHNLNLNYNSFSQFSNIGFFARLRSTYTKNNISNTKSIDEFFVQTTTPINTDYAFNTSLYANIYAPIKFLKHRINLSNNISYNSNILFVNGDENTVGRVTDNIRISLDNWKKDLVDIEYGARIGINSTSYSNSTQLNQSYINSEYFMNLDLDFKKDLSFGTRIRHNIYSGEDFGEQVSLTRWQASISKVFLASKKLRAEFLVMDILDQNQNINRSSNSNYIQDERIESLGRYFMLSLSYSFSGFGNSGGRGGGRGGGGRR